MVALRAFPPPRDLQHQQNDTRAFVEGGCLGNGTLYISHSTLAWLNENGEGFMLEYPAISLHAVCKDVSRFPHQCLYVMLDVALASEFQADKPAAEDGEELEEEDEGTEEDSVRELRFVPNDITRLDEMYKAMSECQKLHPDPEDASSEEEAEEGYFESLDDASLANGGFFTDESGLDQLTPEGRANLARMLNRMEIQDSGLEDDGERVLGGGAQNGRGDKPEDPNQFDDAEGMDQ